MVRCVTRWSSPRCCCNIELYECGGALFKIRTSNTALFADNSSVHIHKDSNQLINQIHKFDYCPSVIHSAIFVIREGNTTVFAGDTNFAHNHKVSNQLMSQTRSTTTYPCWFFSNLANKKLRSSGSVSVFQAQRTNVPSTYATRTIIICLEY